MAEMTFNCPACGQGIALDEQWAGHQIQCPTCQAAVVVPQNAPAPQPSASAHNPLVPKPPAGGTKLSAGSTQVARSSSGTGAVQRGFQPVQQKKQNPALKWAIVGVVVIAVAGGGYWAADHFGLLGNKEDPSLAKPAEVKKDGQADAGNPDGATRQSRRQRPTAPTDSAPPAADGTATAAAAPETNAPIVPATWTLDLDKAVIPAGTANGSISGTNFVLEAARFDRTPTAYVLSLRQGSGPSMDRGVVLYLHLKPGESPTGHVFTVSKEMRGAAVPTVTKVWKNNPRYAPQQKSFSTGYALKLELGQFTENTIAGKIFLALPDTEQSVVAGAFKATTTLGDPNADAAAAAAAAAAQGSQPAPDSAAKAAFERRYGIRR